MGMATPSLDAITIIAATLQGTGLVAIALYLGFNGVLLTSWLAILGAVAGYKYHSYRTIPPLQPS